MAQGAENQEAQAQCRKSACRVVRDDKPLRYLAICFAVDGLLWGAALTTYSAGLLANFDIRKEPIAQLALAFNITNLALQVPAGKIVEKLGAPQAFISNVAMGFGVFGCIILAWIFRAGSFLAFLIIGQVFFCLVVHLPFSRPV